MKHSDELPEVEPVKLKPFLGVRPGVYLLISYTLILVLAVFFIGFFPGIKNGGRYVTFNGTLSGSGVYCDDTYLGSADYQYFIKSGSHKIMVKKADVTITSMTISVDHPVFFTWLVHRTKNVSLPITEKLTEQQKKDMIRFDVQEIVRYSAITEFDNVTVYPPLFSNLRKDLAALKMDEQVLGLAGAYITSKNMYDDARSTGSTDSLFLKELDEAKRLFDSQETSNLGLSASTAVTERKRTVLKAGAFSQDGITYPQTTFVMGDVVKSIYPDTNEAGVQVTCPAFTIATNPVNQLQWAQFIDDNPQWAKTNAEKLLSEGLTDAYYLALVTPTLQFSPSGKPITNVSLYAAKAFCAWLSEKTGKHVFLPTEAQWSLASQGVSGYRLTLALEDDSSSLTPSSMLGCVWELTDTSYIPLSRLCGYEEIHALSEAWGLEGEVIVKGGSYLNSGVTADTIGAVKKDACGDAIGFRIAWTDTK